MYAGLCTVLYTLFLSGLLLCAVPSSEYASIVLDSLRRRLVELPESASPPLSTFDAANTPNTTAGDAVEAAEAVEAVEAPVTPPAPAPAVPPPVREAALVPASAPAPSRIQVIVEVPHVYRGRFERAVGAVESDTGARLTVLGTNRDTGLCPILVTGPSDGVEAARERLHQACACALHPSCTVRPCHGLSRLCLCCCSALWLADLAGRHEQPHCGGSRGTTDCHRRLVHLCG
jgi:hypothetical protein